MSKSSVTLWDIYLQVNWMKLNNPAKFFKYGFVTFSHRKYVCIWIFYISCFLWHYPSSSISIIYAAFTAYENKIINSLEEWKRMINT